MRSPISPRGASTIRTNASIQTGSGKPFKKYIKIASLELQKNLLGNDLERLVRRVEEVKKLYKNVVQEQSQLLAEVNNSNSTGKAPSKVLSTKQISNHPVLTKAHNPVSANIPSPSRAGSFHMQY